MASATFDSYNRNLRRILMAELIDDHLQSQFSWRRRTSPNGTLVSEAVRGQVRERLISGLGTPL